MSDPKYTSHSKFLGAIGENNTIIQFINTSADAFKKVAKDLFYRMFPQQAELDLMRERHEYYKSEVEIFQRRLEIERQKYILEQNKFNHQVATTRDRSRREQKILDLKKQENLLLKEEISSKQKFYSALVQTLTKHQQVLLRIKSKEIQANWDVHHLPFLLSREETKRVFQRRSGLLILLAPPKLPNDVQGFSSYIEREIEDALSDSVQRYFSIQKNVHPIDFCKIFSRPIHDIEAAYTRELIIRPTLILSSEITDHKVYMTITSPIDMNNDKQNIIDEQHHISWNWEDLAHQLELEGRTRNEVIRVVRELIVTMHVITAVYFSDLYYLSFDPFYELKLIQLVSELPDNLRAWIEPYSSSVAEIQMSRRITALQHYADQTYISKDFLHAYQAYRQLSQLQGPTAKLYYNIADSLFLLLEAQNHNLPVPISYFYEAAENYRSAFSEGSFYVDLDNYVSAFRYAEISLIISSYKGDELENDHEQIAINLYNKIIKLAKNYDLVEEFVWTNDIFYRKGEVLYRKGKYFGAFKCFDKIVSKDNQDGDAWIYRSICARKLGNLREALVGLYKYSRVQKRFWNSSLWREEAGIITQQLLANLGNELERVQKHMRSKLNK